MKTGNNPCDIIIPVWNKPALTRRCLDSIYGNTDSPFNLILVDNGSDAETKGILKSFEERHRNVTLTENANNVGWVKAVNQGIPLSKSPHIVLMNNDTVVRTAGWLDKLIDIAGSEPDIGLVNPCFDTKNIIPRDKTFIEVDFCRGYCVLIRREVIDAIGLLDEAYGFGYYDDDDYSMRAIRAGFRCVMAPGVYVEHLRDSTFSSIFDEKARMDLHEKNKELFFSKWGRRLKLAFFITGRPDEEELSRLLMSLARRQHVIHVWTRPGAPISCEHINIRQKAFSPNLFNVAFFGTFLLNRLKREGKRYDLIFSDRGADIASQSGEILKSAEERSKIRHA